MNVNNESLRLEFKNDNMDFQHRVDFSFKRFDTAFKPCALVFFGALCYGSAQRGEKSPQSVFCRL